VKELIAGLFRGARFAPAHDCLRLEDWSLRPTGGIMEV
jgi:hypothetical protein